MVYWSDDVPESPESMVVGTRCNFACLSSMVREMLFCRCMAKSPNLTKEPYIFNVSLFNFASAYLKSTIAQLLLHKITFGSLEITISC